MRCGLPAVSEIISSFATDRCYRMRTRQRSSARTRNHVVLTCDRPSLGNGDADCRPRDRLRHFRSADVDGCPRLYRSFVDDCDLCRAGPRRAAADGSPAPPLTSADFRSNGGPPPKMAAAASGCDVIRTVSSARAPLECPECMAESGRTLPPTVDRHDLVGPLSADSQHPRSPITI